MRILHLLPVSQFQIRGLPSLFYKEGQAAVTGHQHGGALTPHPVRGPSPEPAGAVQKLKSTGIISLSPRIASNEAHGGALIRWCMENAFLVVLAV